MFELLLILPKAIEQEIARRAFSSVGRASPLQGEGQKFESSNAHHFEETRSKDLFFIAMIGL